MANVIKIHNLFPTVASEFKYIADKKLIDMFGTPDEKKEIDAINKRHKQTGYIQGPDYQKRYKMTNKYFSKLK